MPGVPCSPATAAGAAAEAAGGVCADDAGGADGGDGGGGGGGTDETGPCSGVAKVAVVVVVVAAGGQDGGGVCSDEDGAAASGRGRRTWAVSSRVSTAPAVVRTGLTAADDAAAAFSGARGGLDMSKTSGGAESEMAGEVLRVLEGSVPWLVPELGVVFSDRRGRIGRKKPRPAQHVICNEVPRTVYRQSPSVQNTQHAGPLSALPLVSRRARGCLIGFPRASSRLGRVRTAPSVWLLSGRPV